MEENNFVGPRDYKKLAIDGVVLVKSKKYSGDEGWMSEPIDFSELTYFLGYRFEPKSIHMFEAPKGIIRGGHLEGRAKSLTVARGLAFVVLVNMRLGDDQGKSLGIYLGEGEKAWGNTILVPEGVLVALASLTDDCLYYSAADRPFNRFDSLLTLDMFDPKLKVEWPEGVKPQLSEKESKIVKLDEFLQTL
ncbi:MAG TPA: dTDP-4-dehydrorhamnose 3,5-epimerase family protein [Spirochaetia bacterium]|nr:dTDP-4-dehydrorhamnose 3,5-epimerase family protein [Spirochaetia bacterium]